MLHKPLQLCLLQIGPIDNRHILAVYLLTVMLQQIRVGMAIQARSMFLQLA